jgi:hypothetical protein
VLQAGVTEVRHGANASSCGSIAALEKSSAISFWSQLGATPNIERLDSPAAGVAADKAGVTVDDRLRTSNPRIFAAGDVCSPFKFTHAADAAARIVIQNALFFGRSRVSALVIPWCTYTDPELAHVGISAEAARRQGSGVETVTVPLDDVDRAVVDEERDGFVRVHHNRGRMLGCTVVAPRAGDMIGVAAYALRRGASLDDLGATIFRIRRQPTHFAGGRVFGDRAYATCARGAAASISGVCSEASNAEATQEGPWWRLLVALRLAVGCVRGALHWRHGATDWLRVIDLTRVVAGPFCPMMLGDMGAEVLQTSKSPETRRRFTRVGAVHSRLGLFLPQRSIVSKKASLLDLKVACRRGCAPASPYETAADSADRRTSGRAASRSSGSTTGAMSALNPRLIYCSISGYGQTGPAAQLPGYDAVNPGRGRHHGHDRLSRRRPDRASAWPSPTTSPGSTPCRAFLLALTDRHTSGLGQHVDIALFEAMLSVMRLPLSVLLATGTRRPASATTHLNIAPYEPLRAKDG